LGMSAEEEKVRICSSSSIFPIGLKIRIKSESFYKRTAYVSKFCEIIFVRINPRTFRPLRTHGHNWTTSERRYLTALQASVLNFILKSRVVAKMNSLKETYRTKSQLELEICAGYKISIQPNWWPLNSIQMDVGKMFPHLRH